MWVYTKSSVSESNKVNIIGRTFYQRLIRAGELYAKKYYE